MIIHINKASQIDSQLKQLGNWLHLAMVPGNDGSVPGYEIKPVPFVGNVERLNARLPDDVSELLDYAQAAHRSDEQGRL